MALKLALGVRETVAGRRLGALGGAYLPMHPCPPPLLTHACAVQYCTVLCGVMHHLSSDWQSATCAQGPGLKDSTTLRTDAAPPREGPDHRTKVEKWLGDVQPLCHEPPAPPLSDSPLRTPLLLRDSLPPDPRRASEGASPGWGAQEHCGSDPTETAPPPAAASPPDAPPAPAIDPGLQALLDRLRGGHVSPEPEAAATGSAVPAPGPAPPPGPPDDADQNRALRDVVRELRQDSAQSDGLPEGIHRPVGASAPPPPPPPGGADATSPSRHTPPLPRPSAPQSPAPRPVPSPRPSFPPRAASPARHAPTSPLPSALPPAASPRRSSGPSPKLPRPTCAAVDMATQCSDWGCTSGPVPAVGDPRPADCCGETCPNQDALRALQRDKAWLEAHAQAMEEERERYLTLTETLQKEVEAQRQRCLEQQTWAALQQATLGQQLSALQQQLYAAEANGKWDVAAASARPPGTGLLGAEGAGPGAGRIGAEGDTGRGLPEAEAPGPGDVALPSDSALQAMASDDLIDLEIQLASYLSNVRLMLAKRESF